MTVTESIPTSLTKAFFTCSSGKAGAPFKKLLPATSVPGQVYIRDTLNLFSFSRHVLVEERELTPFSVTEIAGNLHTNLALTKYGKVYSWGLSRVSGAFGRDSSGSDPCRPGLVYMPAVIVKIACCNSSVAALTEDGQVYGWGTFESEPQLLAGLDRVVSISASEDGMFAVTDSGVVFSWGANMEQLGRPATREDRMVPVPSEVTSIPEPVKRILECNLKVPQGMEAVAICYGNCDDIILVKPKPLTFKEKCSRAWKKVFGR
ncbi:regulator of chromosome condensation 1/beta-lactamase-inhibitor protein II [Obelidium mucronatum]|nr:regulator of chromosome condensation 1/beta-lactamase-inhibitor protein II [Obelidium mucronatum]